MKEFSLLGFVEHLAVMGVEVVAAEREALERAAVIVESEAKASIGTYQSAAGPFEAWPELAESTKADRLAQGFSVDEPELRTGALRDSIEHRVVGLEAHVGSDSDVMVYQELGTSKMPARSILGGAAVRKADEVLAEIAAETVTALSGVRLSREDLRLT